MKKYLYKKCNGLFNVIFVSVFLSGCQSIEIFKPQIVKYHEDLGSVHVTVLPPVNFDNYRDSIQPVFKMDEASALQQVLPITRINQNNSRSFKGIDASVSLPTKIKSSEETITNVDGVISSSSTSTEKKESGTLYESTTKVSPFTDSLSPSSSQVTIASDPFLKYWTATALFQEVKMINRFYKDLSFSDEYKAYIVRLNLAVLPKVRNAPYDAVVDLSFFSGDSDKFFIAKKKQPKIIPLLVRDNIESNSNSITADKVKNLSLLLKGITKGIGIGASISNYQQIIESVLGKDFNSLLTVARISDNVLRIRLGATQQSKSPYALIPKNHIISAVVLIPVIKDDGIKNNTLWVSSKTKFNNALTGAVLTSKYYDEKNESILTRVDQARKAFKKYGISGLNDTQISKAIDYFQKNNFLKFSSTVKQNEVNSSVISTPNGSHSTSNDYATSSPSKGYYSTKSVISTQISGASTTIQDEDEDANITLMWLDIADILSDSNYDMSSIILPKDLVLADAIFTPSEAITLLDDGKKSQLIVRATGQLNEHDIFASLKVTNPMDKGDKGLIFLSTQTSSNGKNRLTFTFPSLNQWNINEKNSFEMEISGVDFDTDKKKKILKKGAVYTSIQYRKAIGVGKPESPIVKMILKNGGKHVSLLTGNKGKLWLQFMNVEPDKETAYLIVDGARIETASLKNSIIADTKEGYQIINNGKIEITLQNLFSDQKFKIMIRTNKKLESESIELTVKSASK